MKKIIDHIAASLHKHQALPFLIAILTAWIIIRTIEAVVSYLIMPLISLLTTSGDWRLLEWKIGRLTLEGGSLLNAAIMLVLLIWITFGILIAHKEVKK